MTRDEILNMSAGREMDALVAEKVMELKVHVKQERRKEDLGFYRRKIEYRIINWVYAGDHLLKSYSTDIAAAWEVVEKLRGESQVSLWTDFSEGWRGYGCSIRMIGTEIRQVISADTAPLAICRAALLATLVADD